MDLRPTQARLLKDGIETIILAKDIQKGDVLIVKPGEKIPTDGSILEGFITVDEQMMTGESIPVEKSIHDKVFGSTILKTGYIKMVVTEVGQETALSKIIMMVEEAQDNKASTQKFMEVFSKYYTPAIVLIFYFDVYHHKRYKASNRCLLLSKVRLLSQPQCLLLQGLAMPLKGHSI